MPLRFIVPALMRVSATATSTSTLTLTSPLSAKEASTSSPSPGAHPLHTLLDSILLTSRAASQKYHARVRRLLLEENEPADSEEEYMWYAYHKDKIGTDEQEPAHGHGQTETQSAHAPSQEEAEYEAQERLKNAWLEKFERRE